MDRRRTRPQEELGSIITWITLRLALGAGARCGTRKAKGVKMNTLETPDDAMPLDWYSEGE
jgi:hypothetical protein